MSNKIILYVGGKRSAVESAEAESIVERFKRESNGNSVHKVDLSCRQWKRESIDKLAEFLEEHSKSVRYVNLADVIAGLMTEEGLGVTEKLSETFKESNLIEIDLSDNAMGPRGLLRVESLFTNSSLQRLYLSNCGLSAESMGMLNTYLSNDDERIANSLTDLVLDKNMIGVGGAKTVSEFLARCKNLEYFSYNGCRPEEEGTKFICQGLVASTNKNSSPALRRLDLEDCTFGTGEDDTDAILPLSEALARCSQLRHLNITDGSLEVDGLKLLVNALTQSKAKLTHLYLGTCPLSLSLSKGATHLVV